MKKHIQASAKYSFRGIRIFFECFLAFLLVYWLFMVVLSRWTVNGSRTTNEPLAVTVYITSNGVHTDIVVPIRNQVIDWGKELSLTEELAKDSLRTRLAFGWGNKQFFLNTKDWSDLTFGTAFGAAFHLGVSAMHIVHTTVPDTTSKNVITLLLSERQYVKLAGFLKGSFAGYGKAYVRIKEHPYGKNDYFFEGKRSYGLTYTCNSWTNDAMKVAEQKACKWTAMKDGIYIQYGKE